MTWLYPEDHKWQYTWVPNEQQTTWVPDTTNMGWICPKCGKGLAPWMAECNCNNITQYKVYEEKWDDEQP